MDVTAPSESAEQKPVFGFVLVGGPLSGAQLRDLRLANELARRGHAVHVWWAMDRTKNADLEPSIAEHTLFSAFRYLALPLVGDVARGPKDALGRALTWLFRDKRRSHFVQKRPGFQRRLTEGMLRLVASGPAADAPLIRRFARDLEANGVTHLMPMLAVLAPFVEAAQERLANPPRLAVTFQGYELYLNYARRLGLERRIHERFRESVAASAYPAIAVSEDYKQRVVDDVGLAPAQIAAIPPGIELPERRDRDAARSRVLAARPRMGALVERDTPIVTFLGRRDAEKGIDLLLYAGAILRRRGKPVELAIAGPTLFDDRYGEACQQIALNLRLRVLWWRRVSDAFRQDLFAASHCIVYPSIHREPFGMVAAEAAAQATPAVVPDWGGVAQAIEAEGRAAGLRFPAWDSGGLADCIERLIEEPALWRELSDNGPAVAAHFSVPRLADRVLAHLGLAEPSEPPAVETSG